ncbi:Flowering time control protein FCA [Acorus gramineus]|uniref:Flowering time control protein FCA n=1 Tax=Acorus gramineus TaxID=55184 RepID=A0AAV9BFJ2_ACOGR|nr:Flowering time control protein FCA [Acorus gramineus]
MDRHRGGGGGGGGGVGGDDRGRSRDRDRDGGSGGGRPSRGPSKWSYGPPESSPPSQHHNRFSRFDGGGGGGIGYHPYRGGPHDGFRSAHGGFVEEGGGGGGRGGPPFPMGGQRRGGGPVGGGGRGGPFTDNIDGRSFAKLFIGSVPKTATEEDIRPMFEEYGNVIEVALIRDKRTGQQQGCCFVKYATSEEADMAIRGLHNQRTLPGGTGPIQVRYADGERERLGAVEVKLFVGSLNKQATEKEIEEIFSPYGRIEDVYIMRDEAKQSRGCAFVKFSNREMAAAAVNALNGIYVMHGCEQPLIVRFADPKRPRPGESRGGPAFGGPGFDSRAPAPYEVRPTQNFESGGGGGRIPSNAWHPSSPPRMGSTYQVGSTAPFESHMAARSGALAVSSTAMGGNIGGINGSFQSLSAPLSNTLQQTFNQSMPELQSVSQQISPMQKLPMTPQDLPTPLQLQHQQTSMAYSQSQMLHMPAHQLGQLQIPRSIGLPSFNQALPSQQFLSMNAQMPISQAQLQQNTPVAPQQISLNLQQHGNTAAITTQQQFLTGVSQQVFQPGQQLVTQGPQALLQQQQAQAAQSSLQSSQQAFSQLQQQLQLMQPSSLNQQQSSQTTKLQSPWSTVMPQTVSSTATTSPASTSVSVSASPAVPASSKSLAPLTCSWTEHTSPEGFKYYYNSVTSESKVAPQMQIRQHPQVQQYQTSGAIGHQKSQDVGYSQLQAPNSAIDPARIQQVVDATL